MTNKIKYILFITIIIYASFSTEINAQENSRQKNTAKETVQKLYKIYEQLEPGSDDATDILKMIERINFKTKKKYLKEENPGALLEAIKEIKTAYDGTTYSPDYKTKELIKAESRKSLLKSSGINETLPWIERGPGNVSGRTQQVLVDPADASGNTWFAATVGGGIWKTSDAGSTWENKTPALSTLSTTCIAVAASNHNIMYAGTGMGFGRVVDLAGSGVWKSTDHGETWFQLQSTANNELLAAINRIVVDPNNENVVLVCSNDDYTSFGPNGGERKSGIFRTSDGGNTWTQVYDPDISLGTATDNRIQQIIANPQNFNTLYAAVNEVGVIKSTNGGLTWFVSANNFALPQDIGQNEGTYQGISTRVELAISPTDTSRIYAAVERPFGVADLYMSKNAGSTWALVNDTGNDPNWFATGGASGAVAYTAGWFNNTIAVSPYNTDVVFVGGVEIYRININSINSTRTTTKIASTQQAHADHHDLKIIPVNQSTNQFKILNANDGGVAISNNGGNTWTQITGIGSTQFYGVDKKPGEDAYIGGAQDNGTWLSPNNTNLNSVWSHVIGGDGFEAAWNYDNPKLLIGDSQNGNYSRSTDGGFSWAAIPDAKAGTAPFISKIASSDIDADLVFTVGSTGIKRSDDFGASWTLTALGTNWLGYRAFDNAEISIADPQIVWATSRLDFKSFIGKKGGIHVSSDGGLSFTEVSQNFPSTVTESSGLGFDPFDRNTAYVLFSAAGTPKILKTTDLGQTWTDISGFSSPAGQLNKSAIFNSSSNGFPDVATYALLVMPYNTNIIWVGTEIGLFISEDGGATWNIADNGLPRVGIFQMFIQDRQVVVTTYGRGVWTVNLPELENYIPPVVTLAPRMNHLVQTTSGDVLIKLDLRSPYDSTKVFINGELYKTIEANNAAESNEVIIPVTQEIIITASAISYKNGFEYKTSQKSVTAFPVNVMETYSNNFSSSLSIDDFTGTGFSITTASGFLNPALHSGHPYGTGQDFILRLKSPIRVASSGAIMQYDDIALVEPGAVSDYTDPLFFDYVIVEGSKDGINWLPLLNGYDATYDEQWLSTFNSNFAGNVSTGVGNASMFRTHTINLLHTFSAGDVIFVRFRLSSDPLVVGWGWAIDNINIQNSVTTVDEINKIPTEFSLDQNYPNPFNPSTNIKYSLPVESNVVLKIFDITGQEIKTLVNEFQTNGYKTIIWNGTNNIGQPVSSGLYVYRIEAGKFVESKKMILLK